MNKHLHRKPDAYYFDRYDRQTIIQLKELEQAEAEQIRSVTSQKDRLELQARLGFSSDSFNNTAISRARHRMDVVQDWIKEDERKDRLITMNPVPKRVSCNECQAQLNYSGEIFDIRNIPLLFSFKCPNGHTPDKWLYPNGQEFVRGTPTCKDCGGALEWNKKREDKLLTLTDTCQQCGKVTVQVYDLMPETNESVAPEDRKKYCEDFVNRKNTYRGV